MSGTKITTYAILAILSVSLFLGCISTTPPKPDGKELYNYITKENNYKKWKGWPGKEALYPGREPHGALLTTYVTDDAFSAIKDKKGTLPHGSIIVKENYNADMELMGITVMYKVKGYDGGHNDWFWARYSNGEIFEEGKANECIDCHAKRNDNDYLWTGDIK